MPLFGNRITPSERVRDQPVIRHWRPTQRHAGPFTFGLKRGALLIGFAVFLTSVAITSIASRDHGRRGVAAGRIATVPVPRTEGAQAENAGINTSDPSFRAPAGHGGNETGALETSTEGGKWVRVTVRRGDTLSGLLNEACSDAGEVNRLIQVSEGIEDLRRLRPGESIEIRIDRRRRCQELLYRVDDTDTLHVLRTIDGMNVYRDTRRLERRLAYVTGTIESSLFEAGQEAGLSDALIMKLVEIFGWDIDFALDLRDGDSFSVIHEEKYWLGQKVADGQILAAEFSNQGKIFRAVGQRQADGLTHYYRPDGASVRRSFLRTPVKFSRISSGFSNGRFHPILKRWRAHKGIDYAADTGTPVRATATGRVLSAGWRGGYGNTVVIKHGGNYSTLYAHLSHYRSGIRPGSYVEQGQIIGYVGKTGLATGPHLHYEFRVNGIHRNPLAFRFPTSGSVPARYRDEFARNAQSFAAKLDLMSRNALASSAGRE